LFVAGVSLHVLSKEIADSLVAKSREYNLILLSVHLRSVPATTLYRRNCTLWCHYNRFRYSK